MPGNQHTQMVTDYQRVEQAIRFIRANAPRQPGLAEIAASVHLSEYHFQRLFSRWAGISPKRFLQYLTKEYAKSLLATSADLLSVAYQAGLSGAGRLYDLFVHYEAVTPGEYKSAGEGLRIHYGFHDTPFGECLLAATGRGICNLEFHPEGRIHTALEGLKKCWENAEWVPDQAHTRELADRIFTRLPAEQPQPLSLLVKGTNFQVKVWEALLMVPAGKLVSYEDLAAYLGLPRAARAVGNAVARNPIMYLIPCHRVIRRDGAFGNYRGGPARKSAMLGWEFAQAVP